MRVRSAVILTMIVALAGCATPQSAAPAGDDTTRGAVSAPSPRVDTLNLLAMPVAVNWDNDPGPDGLRVRLFLFQQKPKVQAVALQRGTVEFVLYNERVPPAKVSQAKAARVWRYEAGALNKVRKPSAVGPVYPLSLDWGDDVPTSDVITLAARLLRPGGVPLYALPIHLSMTPR